MTDAEQFYAWAVFFMFAGVMILAFAAVAIGLLETRAKRTQQRHQHTAERDQERAL